MLGDDPLEQPSSVGQVSSPFSRSGHQILEFCESNLLFPLETTTTLQDSGEVVVSCSSNAGCCCYEVDSSYPLPTKSPAADHAIIIADSTTAPTQLLTTEDDTNNFSIIFDEEEEKITTDDHINDDIDYSVNLDLTCASHHHPTNNNLEFEQLLDLTLLEAENQQMLQTTTTDHCNMMMMNNTNNNGPIDLPYTTTPHPNDHVVPVFGQTTIALLSRQDDYLSSSSMPPSKFNNNHPSSSSSSSSSSPNYCSFMDPCSYLSNNPLLPPPPPPPPLEDLEIFNANLCLLDEMQQGVENNTGRGIFNCTDTKLPQLLQAAAHSSYDHVNAVNINNNGGARGTTPSSEITSLEADTYTVTNKLTVEERKEKINRYMKKRNQRNFTKKIKYACRKTLADSRPRVRGRFAKNDEYGSADHNVNNRTTLLCCTNHEDEADEDVKSNYHVVVKEEEEMMNYESPSSSSSDDIFAHINGLNSFKYNNNNYPIQSWI